MSDSLKQDCIRVIEKALEEVKPEAAVKKALAGHEFSRGKILLVSIGKAGYSMAHAAYEALEDRITDGIVITKYDHSKGPIGNLKIQEAGHPVLDENSIVGTEKALELTEDLKEEDTVLFLVSGGGSALFEAPKVSLGELQDVTKKLLACGADITEMNTIRKRLSHVKGGKFALHCAPAHVFQIVLSDIIGDPLDMIASGPAYPDNSTADDALAIVKKYSLDFSEKIIELLAEETPKELTNVETLITGSVRELCRAATEVLHSLGYDTVFLTDRMACEAKEAGSLLGSIAASNYNRDKSVAYIAGGETVVHLTGSGLGGRNQEIALAAAREIKGLENVAIFSLGSDGTDGPTDAAGGIVTGETFDRLKEKGYNIDDILKDNDAYRALKAVDCLVMTGPTGTNVNDVSVVMIKK